MNAQALNAPALPLQDRIILVTGATGLVGGALLRERVVARSSRAEASSASGDCIAMCMASSVLRAHKRTSASSECTVSPRRPISRRLARWNASSGSASARPICSGHCGSSRSRWAGCSTAWLRRPCAGELV